MQYVEILKNRRNDVGRNFCDDAAVLQKNPLRQVPPVYGSVRGSGRYPAIYQHMTDESTC